MIPRAAHLWLPGYLRSRAGQWGRPAPGSPVHILFCLADHFEPAFGAPGLEVERRRVATWVERLPRLASRFADADGRPPQHTFFFPEEEYREEHLEALAGLCRAGFGEVEVHLHHDADTSAGVRAKLERFTARLAGHGLLCRPPGGGPLRYGFIHGNWALDNSRPDGRWCGVNDELTVLRETGCYADFTLPSAPSEAQTRTVNRIYYATDDPARPKSHDVGVPAAVGRPPSGDLLIVQGPLALDWRRRKWGVLPRLENGALQASNPPTLERFARWVEMGIGVAGRPEWVFVKVHTHGAPEANAATLLGEPMARFHESILARFNDGRRYRLHYVTAREMVNIVRAAEEGRTGDPGAFRDHELRWNGRR